MGMTKKLDFPTYFSTLDEDEQERFAKDAGTTAEYIRTHLIAPSARRKTPRRKLMDGLAKACESRGAGISKVKIVQYFYGSLA